MLSHMNPIHIPMLTSSKIYLIDPQASKMVSSPKDFIKKCAGISRAYYMFYSSHIYLITLTAMQKHKQLVVTFLRRRIGFALKSVFAGFVVDKVAMRHVFLRDLQFSPISICLIKASNSCMIHLGHGPWALLVSAVSQRHSNYKKYYNNLRWTT